LTPSPRLPSNRAFGALISALFALIAAAPLLRAEPPRLWAGAALALVLAITLLAPRWLTPANRAWMWLGRAIGVVVSPIVLGITFFLVLTPLAIVARLLGRDPVGRRFVPDAQSYWSERAPRQQSLEELRRPY
jgi:hypothetical protein